MTDIVEVVPAVAAAATTIAPAVLFTTTPPPAAVVAPQLHVVPQSSTAVPAASVDGEPAEGQWPPWMARRLERERTNLLRDLGVEKTDDARAAIAAHRAKIEADKTELQRLTEERDRLLVSTSELATYRAAVAAQATSELATLTPERRAVVMQLAGENPAKQLEALTALRPTWITPPPVVAATTTAAAVVQPPPLPPPANTAPLAGSPPPNPPPHTDHLSIFEALDKTNPFRAADYYEAHKGSIEAAKKARAQ